MKQLLTVCLALLFFVENPSPLPAQTAAAPVADSLANVRTAFGLLARDTAIHLTIESDFARLRRQKKLKKWQPATLKFTDAAGAAQALGIEIRAGGVSRLENCNWPPIKIRFPEAYLDAAGVQSKNSVEVFLVCHEADRYRQYLMLEYAAYRLYGMLTDRSFRTQLAKVRLVGSEKGGEEMSELVFLLEHPEDFAARKGGRRLKPKAMAAGALQEDAFDLLCLFEFMVGNTDWYPANRHNIEFFAFRGSPRPVPVAFDFDYSGLVDAPYACPHPAVPIKDVTQRYYQGLCREKGELEKTVRVFAAHKEEMLDFCRAFPYFTEGTRKSTLKYLDTFFAIIENPKKTEREVLGLCDEWFRAPKD